MSTKNPKRNQETAWRIFSVGFHVANGPMIGIYKPVKVYLDAWVERTDIGVKANMQKVPTATSAFIQRAGDARGAHIV